MAKNDFHAQLIDTEGNPISCTIKTPKLKLVRQFRRQSRKLETVREIFADIAAAEEKIAQRVSDIRMAMRNDGADAAKLGAQLKDLESQRDKVLEEKDANDSEVYAQLIEQADMILIYPNREGVTEDPQRTKKNIDWEESDLREIRGAIDFFSDCATTSSNNTRS